MKKFFLFFFTVLFIIFILPGMILGFELGYVFSRGSILCGIQSAFMFIPEFIQHPSACFNIFLHLASSLI